MEFKLSKCAVLLLIGILMFPSLTYAQDTSYKEENNAVYQEDSTLKSIRVIPRRVTADVGTPEEEIRSQIEVQARYKGKTGWETVTDYQTNYDQFKDSVGGHRVKIVYKEGECCAETILCVRLCKVKCKETPVTFYKYVGGYEDGTFRADQPVTREELATMVARLITDNNVPDESNTYPDLDPNRYSTPAINYVTKEGLFKPYEDGTFRAKDPISDREFEELLENLQPYLSEFKATPIKVSELVTRAEAVVILNNFFERACEGQSFTNQYKDLEEGYWAYDDILCASNTFTATVCK